MHLPVCAPDESGLGSTRVNLIFSTYKDQQGGEPLWQESQNVDVDAAGHYSTLLGLSSPEGVPQSIFTSSDAQWLGIRVNNGPESPRSLLVTVAYAMKAQSADALSGVPASGYVLRSELPQILQSLVHQPASSAISPAASSSTLIGQPFPSVSNFTRVMQSNSNIDVLLVEQDGSGLSLHAVGTGDSASKRSSAVPVMVTGSPHRLLERPARGWTRPCPAPRS